MSTTLIIDEGKFISIDELDLSKRIDKIPAMVYYVRMTGEGKAILAKARDKFDILKRRFGKHDAYKKEIVSRYLECKDSCGALFNGLKGAGKSMLAEDICNELIGMGFPIIHIDSELPPSILRRFMKYMGPCGLYFDEFGKYYKEEQRNTMLTFFSATDLDKVLFLVTSNSMMELNDFMIDRPGRFLFRINFEGVDEEILVEIIEEWKLAPVITEYLIEYCKVHRVSFDVVNAISRAAVDSRTVKEFCEKLKILNVPQGVYSRIRVREVMYNGEKWLQDYTVIEEEGIITIKLFKKATADIEYTAKIEWLTAKKVMLNPGEFNVEFDEVVTVKMMRMFVPFKTVELRETLEEGDKSFKGRRLPGDLIDPTYRGQGSLSRD